MNENIDIHKTWNECVDKTNDVVACLEMYTEIIRKETYKEIKDEMLRKIDKVCKELKT